MNGHGSVAKSVRLAKEARPDRYCRNPKCLWRTEGCKKPCPRHAAAAKIPADFIERVEKNLEKSLEIDSAIRRHVASGEVTAQPRTDVVTAAVMRMRLTHPEVMERPTYAQILTVFEREDVLVQRAKLSMKGRAMELFGHAVVQLNSSLTGDELVAVALHEMGHVCCHVFDKPLLARIEAEVNQCPPVFAAYDQCEAEADLFCAMILLIFPSDLTPTAGAGETI